MHMQKHAYGVWSTDPGPGVLTDAAPYMPPTEPLGIVGRPRGRPPWRAYSVLHGRDGGPERAVLVCDLPGGGRCYALLDGGAAVLRGRGRRTDRAARHPHAGRRGQPRRSRLRPVRLPARGAGPMSPASTAARGGWVVVTHHPTAPERRTCASSPISMPSIARVDAGELAAVAIDIPIGLAPAGPRRADIEARGQSGPRRSSVFPAPARAVLAATTYEEACALSRPPAARRSRSSSSTFCRRSARSTRSSHPAANERLVRDVPRARAWPSWPARRWPMPRPRRRDAAERRHALGTVVRPRRDRAPPAVRPRRGPGPTTCSTPSPGAWTAGVSPLPSTCGSAASGRAAACAWRWWPDRRHAATLAAPPRRALRATPRPAAAEIEELRHPHERG